MIGISSAIPAGTACNFFDTTENPLIRLGNLADGESGDFGSGAEKHVNVAAVVSPYSPFTSVTPSTQAEGDDNSRRHHPQPGPASVAGKGLRGAGAEIGAPETIKLVIRAKGKRRGKLLRTGHAKLRSSSPTRRPAGNERPSH